MVEASAELEAAEREKRHPSLDRLYRANRYFQFLQALVQVEEADPNVALRVIRSWLHAACRKKSPVPPGGLKAYAAACDAYAAGDESTAAETLRQLSGELESILPMDSFKLHFEHCINALEPFFGGFILYGMSLVCFVVSLFLKRRKALLHFATVFLCMAYYGIYSALRPHTFNRPPVTNLYSSVVFAGVVASLFGGTLYILRRQLPVAAVACASGLLSLLVAMNLPYSGDTMGMMRAVLNSNFWLTMHVMTIMIGYGSVFFAGFLASYHLVARFFGFGQGEKGLKAGSCGVYRILLVALFFCFLGTMLGGIWADMSWGRFWGWDPKENGALMTLLWCSCTLHARLLHVCSCQGFLVLASLGNIVAAWGWFGVNLMGIGLHSYGFVEGGWFWFFLFVGLQVLAAASALIPQRSR
ncbi:MAG: cytochrome c biogenesis protein [Akkermansia muciniphila]